MAEVAARDGHTPPQPYKADKYRANVLWLERFMRAGDDGIPVAATERPQSLRKVILEGWDPTRCYERVSARVFGVAGAQLDVNPRPRTRRGPAKGVLYDRNPIDLVAAGERLLPGSKNAYYADFWCLLQRDQRDLRDTHRAIEKHLQMLGLARPSWEDRKLIGFPLPAEEYQSAKLEHAYLDSLIRLIGSKPAFDINLFSLLANLVHEAFLMGNPELHNANLAAFVHYYRQFIAIPMRGDLRTLIRVLLQRRLINQDWWPTSTRNSYYPVTISQLVMPASDWDRLKPHRNNLSHVEWYFELPDYPET